ncbi:MAG: 23S rRNA (pseudouridine(1915)-N(3))-methyltransferase RlmH [Candidatus Peregrinibacteria bacterium]|nr:23S rRNA (pseudouridine(1915)-N(3))-methyltransferase RlmH [Candidatus Peregrinibacteria bacterium]
MKIKLYFFGKKNEITDRERELAKRIGFRAKCELIPLSQAGITEPEKAKELEGDKFLSKICDRDFIIAFDEHGKKMSSVDFSSFLNNSLVDRGDVIFLIGGAHGIHQKVLDRVDQKISFGEMVWTRNLFRTMALEQIYRALEIAGGGNFHKA